MANFMKKLVNGLVEDSQSTKDVSAVEPIYTPDTNISIPVEEVHPSSNVDTSNLFQIEDVYNYEGLTNFEKSIYKVAEIVNALPESIATETKKESVAKMLKVTGLTIEEVKDDANKRIEVLKAAEIKFNQETNSLIEENEKLIEEYNQRIIEYKLKIENRKLLQEQQDNIIAEEIKAINKIQEFI